MFVLGVKKYIITGYQHAVIPQGWLLFSNKLEDKYSKSLPNKIITTGIIPYNYLKNYGYFNNTDLEIGGSFRYNYLYNIICKRYDHKFNLQCLKILVALDGMSESIKLVYYIIKQADLYKNIYFTIRQHPGYELNKNILLQLQEIQNIKFLIFYSTR